MQLSAPDPTRHKAANQTQEVLVKRPVQSLIVAAGLVAATLFSTSPAAAYTPVFMKICGVDGESGSEAKPERKPTKPDRKAVSVAAPDARSDSTAPAAAPDRKVKKPASKPAPALLVPAIQKAR